MKNLIIFLVVLLLGFVCNAQPKPVFNYTNPPKDTLLKLAMDTNVKGFEYRTILIKAGAKNYPGLTTSLVVATFGQLFYEEVTLEEGNYTNSGWNSTTQKMEEFPGHHWHGMAWVFRCNGIVFVLIKGDCGNVVFCKPFTTTPQQVNLVVEKVDTIYKTVVINQYQNQNSNQNQQNGYQVNKPRRVNFGTFPTYNYGGCNNCGGYNYRKPNYSGNNSSWNNSRTTKFGAENHFKSNSPKNSQPHNQTMSSSGSNRGRR
jgi:hypothetical protein